MRPGGRQTSSGRSAAVPAEPSRTLIDVMSASERLVEVTHGTTSVLMIEQGGRGGVSDYTEQLSRALACRGWSITLATAADHRYPPVMGITIRPVFHYVRGHSPLARASRRLRLGPAANGLRFLLAIPRLLRLSHNADIVHAQGWEYAPLGLLAIVCLRLAGATVVQTTHNTFERGRLYRVGHDLTQAGLARLTARTIVHTRADLARVPRTAGGRVVVIPHGEYSALAAGSRVVDRLRARAALGISQDTPVTLLFGYLRPDKGLRDLLAALIRLPRIRLLIAGTEQGALAASAGQLTDPRLAGRVTIREGFLEMDEAAILFAATDTVTLPYAVASQSGILLLSYGFRRPVIVYPVGGLVEAVIDGETGWICRRPDIDALVDALRDAADAGWDECRRRGEAGAKYSATNFGWPVIALRTSQLYCEVLEQRRASPRRARSSRLQARRQ